MTTVENILEHHGVKGMRWGVRNKSKSEKEDKPRRPEAHELSDDEIRRFINRVNMERQYKSLTKEERKREATIRFIQDIGKTVVKGAITMVATYHIKRALEKHGIIG